MSEPKTALLQWHIYEVRSQQESLHGVMLRGRIRKLGLEQHFNVLCENASDTDNCVRFAVLTPADADKVSDYLQHTVPDAVVTALEFATANPVLSKLKINKTERYTL